MMEKLRILNLEDNRNDAELNKTTLEGEGLPCDLTCVETREAFLAAIKQGGHDIILVDYSLPTFDGLSALKLAREHCPDIPFIFVSGTLGEENAIEALKSGATDYIIKDRLSRLAPSVRRALKVREESIERRRAEQALLERENTLQSIFRAAPVGIGVVSDRVILQVNDRICQMVGYSRQELIGQNGRILYLTDDDFDYVGKEKYAQMREVGTGTVETRWRCKDGKVIDVLLSSSPINQKDEGSGVTFTALDITERKRYEGALSRSEERLRRLIGQTFDIIYETDEFGFVKNVSPQSEQVFGLRPEAMVGRHFQEFLKESERERVMELFHKALQKERVGTVEFTGKKSDGSDVFCEMRHVLEEEESRVVGTFGVIRDMTEKRKMQTHLHQSQKMESIGTLAGGIAHDFNNILGAIIGYTQLALYDLPEESPLKYNFDQVLKASDRARDLVKQILSFSRQSEQEQGPLQLLPVLKEALKLLRASLPTNIEIKKNLSIKEDVIIGDPTQIHQVIMNLCTNAAQAIRGRQGLIEVTLEEMVLSAEDMGVFPGLSEGPFLRLNVRDTGEGIDPTILPRIFDPFFTTKKTGQGTGMGLSVVHGIVKSHHGEITVTSEPGRGTTFSVYLPQIKRPTLIEEDNKGPLLLGKERILFVDDEPGMVDSWVQMLGRLGYKVFSRVNSIEAMETFRAAPDAFDLVITDQTMPHMSGSDLAVGMLAIRPNIPIILCSGFSETITSEMAGAMGIRKFLMKPILLREMATAIRKVLKGEDG